MSPGGSLRIHSEGGCHREALRILEAEIARVDARMRELVGGKP